MKRQLENDAIEALRQTLSQISVVKIKEIKAESHHDRGERTIIAHVEIYGHMHKLICKLVPSCSPIELQRSFVELQRLHAKFPGEATPVLIAPMLTEEGQALCRDSNTGFLDLEGTARIYLDEVFIVKRSLAHHRGLPPSAEPLPTRETARFAGIA